MTPGRREEDYDALLGAMPSRAPRRGAVAGVWVVAAGLIALVMLAPLLPPASHAPAALASAAAPAEAGCRLILAAADPLSVDIAAPRLPGARAARCLRSGR